MVTIVPSLYTGKGLLSDDNQIFDNFAGGLLRGFTINPTPVAGQYFTPVGGGTPSVTGGMQDDEGMSEEDFARLMEQYRNQQNLLNEGDPADDFEFAPPGADPGTYGGSPLEFFTDPEGFLSMFTTPGASPFGTIYQGFQTGKTGKTYAERMREEMGQRQFADGFEYSGYDEPQSERDAAFDADMQDEE